jgi:hypothetical protein
MSGKDYESSLRNRPRPSQGKTIGVIVFALLAGLSLLFWLAGK